MNRSPSYFVLKKPKKTTAAEDLAIEAIDMKMLPVYEQVWKNNSAMKKTKKTGLSVSTKTPQHTNDNSYKVSSTGKNIDKYEELYRALTEKYPVKSTEISQAGSSRKHNFRSTTNSAHKTDSSTPLINSASSKINKIDLNSKKVTFSDNKVGPTSGSKSSTKKRRSSNKFCSKLLNSTENKNVLTGGKQKNNLTNQCSSDRHCAKKLFSPMPGSFHNDINTTMEETQESASEDNKENDDSNLLTISDDEEDLKRYDSSEEFQRFETACASPVTPTQKKKKTLSGNEHDMFATLNDFIIKQNNEMHNKIMHFVTVTINANNEAIAAKVAELQGNKMQQSNCIKTPLVQTNKKTSNLRVNTLKKTIKKKVADTPRTNKKMKQAIGIYNSMCPYLDSPKREKCLLGTPLASQSGRTALSIKIQKQCLSLVD